MYSIMAAIKTLFDQSLADFFTGGYAHRIGPVRQDKPALVVALVGGGESDRNTGTRKINNPRVRFTTIASDDQTAATGSDKVDAAIQTLPRNISTANGDEYVARVTLKAEELAQDPDQDVDQTEVWYGIREYEFVIGRKPS